MPDRTAILYQLGKPESAGDWPDYLQYGFGAADVPRLLDLVSDQSLHGADAESNEVWVPLHAWRTLGQLHAPDAAAPLIALFDDLHEDDWALNELSQVLGAIGETGIALLAACLNDTRHAEFARVMAVDSLVQIALQHPALRDRVLGLF